MKYLVVLLLLALTSCGSRNVSSSPIYGKWVDIENYPMEFKADSQMTIDSCKIKGGFTEPAVDGEMTLIVTESQLCLPVGVAQCHVDIISQDEMHIACGALNTRIFRQP